MTLTEDRPIFQQIAEQLEEAILSRAYPEESQVPSITEYSVQYRINPATALKGINLLVDAGLLYKKRGVGMFVASGAREKLRQSRRERFYQDYVQRMVREARNLGLTDQELQGLQAEVIVDVPAVDGDSAGAVGEEMHAGHGGLPAAGAIQIRLLALIHSFVPPA